MSHNIFERFQIKIELYGTIRTEGPFRIGLGREQSIVESDLPVIKNASELPIIPGSSLKGLFRGTLMRLLNSRKNPRNDRFITELFGGKEPNEHAAAMLFHTLSANSPNVKIQKHIKINPETMSVSHLFDLEYVPEKTEFTGAFVTFRNLSPIYLGVIQSVINLLNEGFIKFGGFKSRGYGKISISIDHILILLFGVTQGDLIKGVDINTDIPHLEKVRIQIAEGKFSLIQGDTNIILESPVEVQDKPEYFGTEITINQTQAISQLMMSCISLVEAQLQTFLGGT